MYVTLSFLLLLYKQDSYNNNIHAVNSSITIAKISNNFKKIFKKSYLSTTCIIISGSHPQLQYIMVLI